LRPQPISAQLDYDFNSSMLPYVYLEGTDQPWLYWKHFQQRFAWGSNDIFARRSRKKIRDKISIYESAARILRLPAETDEAILRPDRSQQHDRPAGHTVGGTPQRPASARKAPLR
jgi:hypothetical protein